MGSSGLANTRAPMVSVGRERAGTQNSNTYLMLTFILFLSPLGKKENSRGKRLVVNISLCWEQRLPTEEQPATNARFRTRQQEEATDNQRAHNASATDVCSRAGHGLVLEFQCMG